jgi:hypothetical protein
MTALDAEIKTIATAAGQITDPAARASYGKQLQVLRAKRAKLGNSLAGAPGAMGSSGATGAPGVAAAANMPETLTSDVGLRKGDPTRSLITSGRNTTIDTSSIKSTPDEFNSKSVHTEVAKPEGGNILDPTSKVDKSKIALTKVEEHAEPLVGQHVESISTTLATTQGITSQIVTKLDEVIAAVKEGGGGSKDESANPHNDSQKGQSNPTENGLHLDHKPKPVYTTRKNTVTRNMTPTPGFNVNNTN